jgi:hypothetical protein
LQCSAYAVGQAANNGVASNDPIQLSGFTVIHFILNLNII